MKIPLSSVVDSEHYKQAHDHKIWKAGENDYHIRLYIHRKKQMMEIARDFTIILNCTIQLWRAGNIGFVPYRVEFHCTVDDYRSQELLKEIVLTPYNQL